MELYNKYKVINLERILKCINKEWSFSSFSKILPHLFLHPYHDQLHQAFPVKQNVNMVCKIIKSEWYNTQIYIQILFWMYLSPSNL